MWMALALMQGATIPLPATYQTDVACAAAIAIELKQAPVEYRPGISTMLAYLVGRLERDMPGRSVVVEIDRARTVQNAAPLAPAARERCFEDAGRVVDTLMTIVPPRSR